ncbi:PREDICTED: leucine-rich repeat-containing protein 15 [Ceratosolen solmsi marchali]|uniref:Leucine-rich repeat-containing protein 15 n=1 Tax=Ceratosolen solmsi marchali TaxID=326594 RepID=A0AAJ6YJA8_9HYME|nr:PREDICTED: leucine-rich repeat-containing protein 15 [Ceratosolen solmsi marchali]
MPDTFQSFLAVAIIIMVSSLGATLSYSTMTTPAAQAASAITMANSTPTTMAMTGTTAASTSAPSIPAINENATSTKETPKIMSDIVWECPSITGVGIECSCDFPHTLRCIGDRTSLQTISRHLRHSRPGMISLLDVTVSGISTLPANFLEDVALHGLVVSTGELRRVNENAFTALARPLQALGLPNNLLDGVPTVALARLIGLERLDLTHNKLKTLEATSFQGLSNVTYLDLSDNLLSQLSPQAFASLPSLRSLKMHGNRLSVSALSALRGLRNLEELDLSANLLSGPLGPSLLPAMPRLRYLTVAENELKNVQQGALMGLKNLTSLSLTHNQIDVLEDDAFKYLSTLTHLDLAYNGIVAVSSSSLAHLEKLKILDLTHNFLRSLNGDLVVPLRSLENLRLDDNDITMVTTDLPTSKLKLKSLSLADNPFNCDCTLLDFANWLANSSLEEEDKLSAVCATPPALENGILTQVSPGNLLCGDPTPPIMTRLPLAAAQLTLNEFHFDETTGADMLWHVEPCTERYTCDTLIVYEAIDEKEVQIASSPIHCDSRLMRDPCSLPISLPTTLMLQAGHRYRYCVVLMVPSGYDELSLGLGCSDIIELEETLHLVPEDHQPRTEPQPEISTVHVNVSSDGYLQVEVRMSGLSLSDCKLDLDVLAAESGEVQRKILNCSSGATTLSGLVPGRYRVCASVNEAVEEEEEEEEKEEEEQSEKLRESKARCVEVQSFRQSNEVLLLLLAAVLCVLVIVGFMVGRNLLRKTKKEPMPPQCFMPAQEVEITHKAHYIKLLATTKV